jgi:hypothetical protein
LRWIADRLRVRRRVRASPVCDLSAASSGTSTSEVRDIHAGEFGKSIPSLNWT